MLHILNSPSLSLFTSLSLSLLVADAHLKEQNSLKTLHQLLVHCCEFLLLWKLLCEHQLHLTVKDLTTVRHTLTQRTTLSSCVCVVCCVCVSMYCRSRRSC